MINIGFNIKLMEIHYNKSILILYYKNQESISILIDLNKQLYLSLINNQEIKWKKIGIFKKKKKIKI